MKQISEMEKKESNCKKIPGNCRYPKNWDCYRYSGFDKTRLCDLDEMVTEYRTIFMEGKERNLKVLSTFTDFICGGANIKEAPHAEKYCKNSHQYRMTRETIKEAHEKLPAAGLDRYDNFADIHAAVTEIASGIKKFGQLATYDFTERYAYSRGILPDGVYLHAGVAIGARELKRMGCNLKIVDLGKRGSMIEMSSLPTPIAELGALHAENFLCIYKDLLAKLAASKLRI